MAGIIFRKIGVVLLMLLKGMFQIAGIVFKLFFGGVKLLLLLFSFLVRIVQIFMGMFI